MNAAAGPKGCTVETSRLAVLRQPAPGPANPRRTVSFPRMLAQRSTQACAVEYTLRIVSGYPKIMPNQPDFPRTGSARWKVCRATCRRSSLEEQRFLRCPRTSATLVKPPCAVIS